MDFEFFNVAVLLVHVCNKLLKKQNCKSETIIFIHDLLHFLERLEYVGVSRI